MHDILQPLLHKASVQGLPTRIARSGLGIGDAAALHLLPDGQIGITLPLRHHILGLIPHRALRYLGHLDDAATALLTPALLHGDHLRVRVVAITAEHLSPTGRPEVHVSVWGTPRPKPVQIQAAPIVP